MTGAKVRFTGEMTRTGANTTGVIVPKHALDELGGGGRPAVTATINGYSYRTTVGTMRGHSMLPFSAQHRSASGIAGGDVIDVLLELDTAPRDVELPDDLAVALRSAGNLEGAFRKQAPSRQRADVDNVVGAKAEDTRTRRIAAIIDRIKE